MTAALIQDGFDVTPTPDRAEIIVINTCSFIRSAKEEAIETILQMARLKQEGSCKYLVVTGCLPQCYGADLAKALPEVDLFAGTGEVPHIANHVRALYSGRRNICRTIISSPDFLMSAGNQRLLFTQPYTAYLKIAEGCTNRCSYCVVPSVRGPARSRASADIVREADMLATSGVKELILIAQDTTAYGADILTAPGLPGLLEELSRIPSLKWIRLLYTNPAGLTSGLFEVIAGNEKFCPYIDMPIQHIDDTILQIMNRRSDSRCIRGAIASARAIIPGVALRTSLIVGFPGESKKRYEKLRLFVEEARFDHLGVFTYSREEGTLAAALPSRTSEKEKQRRRDLLMELQSGISLKINQSLIGSIQEVLVEATTGDSQYPYIGRCRRQAPEIDGITYIKGKKLTPGDFVACRITHAGPYDLFASV
jgi:ribosomal protein S12 methylthiotransferase